MIKRIIENLKWLFNHPPTGMTGTVPPGSKCKYCSSENGLLRVNEFAVCWECVEKAFDAALSKKKDEGGVS